MAQKITETTTKKAAENGIIWDTDIPGFGLRVNAGKRGITRAFILNYRIHGRERRYTIGKFPAWSAQAARDKAKVLRRQVDTGTDPLAERQAADAASTVAEVWQHYEEIHLPTKRASSRKEDRAIWERNIKPEFGRRKAHTITRTDVAALHRKIAATAPTQANRVLSLVSKLFNFAKVDMSLPIDNPAKGVRRTLEEPRERFLSDEEYKRLLETLAEFPYMQAQKLPKAEWHEQDGRVVKSRLVRRERPEAALVQSASIIRLIMLTGCRKHEALSATWDQLDLKAGIWTKPSAHTKQKKAHRVPLSKAALMLLAKIRERTGKSKCLFPGIKPGTHQGDVKSAWETIRTRAGIPDVRIHDLRHQFASVLVSSGQSLPVIGRLLGHTQAQTTERYAHLFDDPLRKATDAAGAILSGQPAAEVVDIREVRK